MRKLTGKMVDDDRNKVTAVRCPLIPEGYSSILAENVKDRLKQLKSHGFEKKCCIN